MTCQWMYNELLSHIPKSLKKNYIFKTKDQTILIKRMDHKSNNNEAFNSYVSLDFSIKKLIYYFMTFHEKIDLIEIDGGSNECCITYNYSRLEKDYTKVNHKHQKSLFDMPVLISALQYYDHGIFFIEGPTDNSFIVKNRKNFNIEGFGFDFDKDRAIQKAVLEYLERHAASIKLDEQIVSSFNDLKQAHNVVHPQLLGVYDEEIYDKDPHLVTYDDDLEIGWCQAYSIKSNDTFYVPVQNAQYLCTDLKNRYVYDNSNGSAIGNSFEEASLFSLYESIERDTFLTFWFGNQAGYQIIFDQHANDLKGRQLYFEHEGYELNFYLLKNEMNIPVIWCLLKAHSKQNNIYSITGLGCHLNIKEAIDAAFFEVYNLYLDTKKQSYGHPTDDRKDYFYYLEDHITYYLHPESSSQLEEKLQKTTDHLRYSELERSSSNFKDVLNELKEVVQRANNSYDDIFLINQTNHFLKSMSLHCVKSVISNAILLDFSSIYLRRNNNALNDKKISEKNMHPLG